MIAGGNKQICQSAEGSNSIDSCCIVTVKKDLPGKHCIISQGRRNTIDMICSTGTYRLADNANMIGQVSGSILKIPVRNLQNCQT